MKVNLLTKKGRKSEKKATLDDSVFKLEVNEQILSRYVYIYLSNQRQSNAHTKDRGDVSGGGKKPWRQKGTGRARHGSIRSPIFKGGGVTFGPTNQRNYKKKMNKIEKKLALKMAFSKKVKEKQLYIIEDLNIAKTKDLESLVKYLKFDGKVVFVQEEERGLFKASRNLPKVEVIRVGELNAYDILNNKHLVVQKTALDKINEIWGIKTDQDKKNKLKNNIN